MAVENGANGEVLVNLQKWPQRLWAAVFAAGDVISSVRGS